MTLSRRRTVAALAALPVAGTAATARAAEAAPPPPRITLYIAGDSTAAQKYAPAAPETGWGMALPLFLTPRLRVANHAVNGRSSKSFLDEGRLGPVLEAVRPGDVLLVQFGHNDQKAADPARHTEPWTTYREHLLRYVSGARARGARPVLLTSVERRRFDASGRAVPTHGEYPAAVRALAAEHGVPLVDVQAASLAEWQRLGPEGSKAYFAWLAPGESPAHPDGRRDDTHFRPAGAVEVARMVARGLLAGRVLAPGDVRRLDDEVPADRITWPPAP
ncbi:MULTISPECIES: rhamnogalacturonan acetylesterase [Streptomyces]|uniref:Rhamnogalacturonan acetylesterase RhgT n=2 Tax=Streptomyces fradiae TaxID=1906 RepID=A0A1Y2NTA8_STRFR|nr:MULTISPECIES: rhamnogalacturonan acetylesterase [Streptomyces]OSY50735.1 Rhamnogalacturonan acetylesterase RhgT [Streptomyces fradiae ATCC 10745 = DSM 40063]QEV11592.1 rhamnogalacturonan acetylesterase [Streptomyces fradiae ATCC 10745 = DSM 40063]